MGLLPNPQTDELLSLLGLDHVVTVQSPSAAGAEKAGGGRNGTGVGGEGAGVTNRTADANEIDLDATVDPNEIQLDDA